ncbi:TetR/AcrR family transcriptional regulator [Enterococcus hulanensis]|uniref:TetR/AcrR family transcriptional regulator n=1 Tax=Enterococcus hulanensis TaxID=2559929 RepID=A0ABU3F3I6_9ENTE|nr:TetR/AcrR family transcriptional regulator [Enterococcus hulanensis]MDT2601679.1 TetR/AcrR family transcriptional regulator [Enterococcus hulanensis]MDT2609179.1 TetR/AcrR family transcriptional regulator [Enterococcus hulanensis]MDT2616780.1 TetR/AcrR family transcriptional regulator [Enterococcus hulanensis]MDT2629509.1 TetR/AcrR family transcriptional regulator [Enterococcus hulanensis]MDT2657176.1 TetR/AcrR family transcriptional regulator [Enterococcus hulanensis]
MVDEKRKLIEEAFLELLQTTEFKKIKISEIAAKAGVSRVTFYKKFQNKEDLLDSIVEDFLAEMTHVFQSNVLFYEQVGVPSVDAIRTNLTTRVENVIRFFWENREKIEILTSQNSEIDLLKYVRSLFNKQLKGNLPLIFSVNFDPQTLNEYLDYLSKGSYLIIGTWIRKRFEDSPEEITEIIVNTSLPIFIELYQKKGLDR